MLLPDVLMTKCPEGYKKSSKSKSTHTARNDKRQDQDKSGKAKAIEAYLRAPVDAGATYRKGTIHDEIFTNQDQ